MALDNQMVSEWHMLLAGNSEKREFLYEFLEEQKILKGPDGIKIYTQIIAIATGAGAPMNEVYDRLTPLLDKERYAEFTGKAARHIDDSDTQEDVPKKKGQNQMARAVSAVILKTETLYMNTLSKAKCSKARTG